MTVTSMVPINEISTRVLTDANMFAAMADSALSFLKERQNCISVGNGWLDRGLAGVIAVFYFEVTWAAPEQYDYVWVINGDLPPMYIPPFVASDGMTALRKYAMTVNVWVGAVLNGLTVDDYPAVYTLSGRDLMPTTLDNAEILGSRIMRLEETLLPWLKDWTPESD